MSISINDYIEYFEKRVRSKEKDMLGHGNLPRYPMLMYYLGAGADKDAGWANENLLLVWPQYEKELHSFYVPDFECGDIYHLSTDGERKRVDLGEIQDITSTMFDEKSHFKDLTGIQIYFLIDTSEVETEDEINKWIGFINEMLSRIKRRKKVYLTLLLNEDFRHEDRGTANRILNSFESYDLSSINNTYILSNRLGDGVILRDMSNCCRLYSDIIMLTNDSGEGLSLPSGIYTAGYSYLGKPLEEIAKVVVETVIDRCTEYKKSGSAGRLFNDALPARLGIMENGVPKLLNDYITNSVTLPTETELMLFPRSNDSDEISSEMTAEALDHVTMGAWSCYLKMIEKKVEKDLSTDSQFKRVWYDKYKKLITENFSTDEILELVENKDKLHDLYSGLSRPSKSLKAFVYAKAQIGYSMCSNPTIISLFMDVISDMAEDANKMNLLWDQLLNSRRVVFEVDDRNLYEFYRKKTLQYFDDQSGEKRHAFEVIHSEKSLSDYLQATLDGIISFDSIFTKPFYQELEERLEKSENPVDNRIYIRNKLLNTVPYLRTTGGLNDPLASTILLKTSTAIHSSLKMNLPEYYYYDTGDDDKAESVLLYQLDIIQHLSR